MISIDAFFQAVLPSLFVSIIMLIFNIKQVRRDKKNTANEQRRKKNESIQLSLILAAAKLSYAVAMAMKNGHPNGEIEIGVDQYQKAMKDFKDFERELVTESRIELL